MRWEDEQNRYSYSSWHGRIDGSSDCSFIWQIMGFKVYGVDRILSEKEAADRKISYKPDDIDFRNGLTREGINKILNDRRPGFWLPSNC